MKNHFQFLHFESCPENEMCCDFPTSCKHYANDCVHMTQSGAVDVKLSPHFFILPSLPSDGAQKYVQFLHFASVAPPAASSAPRGTALSRMWEKKKRFLKVLWEKKGCYLIKDAAINLSPSSAAPLNIWPLAEPKMGFMAVSHVQSCSHAGTGPVSPRAEQVSPDSGLRSAGSRKPSASL